MTFDYLYPIKDKDTLRDFEKDWNNFIDDNNKKLLKESIWLIYDILHFRYSNSNFCIEGGGDCIKRHLFHLINLYAPEFWKKYQLNEYILNKNLCELSIDDLTKHLDILDKYNKHKLIDKFLDKFYVIIDSCDIRRCSVE